MVMYLLQLLAWTAFMAVLLSGRRERWPTLVPGIHRALRWRWLWYGRLARKTQSSAPARADGLSAPAGASPMGPDLALAVHARLSRLAGLHGVGCCPNRLHGGAALAVGPWRSSHSDRLCRNLVDVPRERLRRARGEGSGNPDGDRRGSLRLCAPSHVHECSVPLGRPATSAWLMVGPDYLRSPCPRPRLAGRARGAHLARGTSRLRSLYRAGALSVHSPGLVRRHSSSATTSRATW